MSLSENKSREIRQMVSFIRQNKTPDLREAELMHCKLMPYIVNSIMYKTLGYELLGSLR